MLSQVSLKEKGYMCFIDDKTMAAFLYVVEKLGKEKDDMHSVFKALYFADRKHLAEYGRMITDDDYIAMNDGPVPSNIYDCCKESRDNGIPFNGCFILKGKMKITPLQKPDMDELSKSDIKCLDEAVEEVREMSYSERVKNSHDSAYENTIKNSRISIIDIAKAGGAQSDVIQYLTGNID